MPYYLTSILILLGFLASFFFSYKILKKEIKNLRVKEINLAIKEGASAFLMKEYKIIAIFTLLVFLLLFFFINKLTALSFLLGAFFSILAGNVGMRVATSANARVAEGLEESTKKGLNIAFQAGSVMGLMVVSLGLLGVAILYFLIKDPQIIYGFGFGASAVALFARVGGGIYTKAADVGADLVGKVESDIPEDDPRNAAVIADNVGDNVGDVAGMGADLFESYVESIIAAMVLGVTVTLKSATKGLLSNPIFIPLFLGVIGLLSSLFGIFWITFSKKKDAQKVFNEGTYLSTILMIIFTLLLDKFIFISQYKITISVLLGLVSGVIIGFISQYYTSSSYSPTKKLAESCQAGAATNIISGLSLGMKSTFIPVIVITLAILGAYYILGVYGIALAGVGMLSTLAICLAIDCYGPVADNAAGIAQMAELGEEIRKEAEKLDAVGNTTAAMGKGFAIGSAALTAFALLVSYLQIANLSILNLADVKVFLGIFIGALLPFLFSAFSMEAVGKAAYKVVEEVRRQFKEIVGLKEGKAKAEYGKCVEIVTGAALKEMILPSLLAIISPVIVGFLLGKESLGGLLIGSISSGFLLALVMANSGGAWDNAKKYIEEGNFGGKKSEPHKAAVIGDTVGDPFKDTAGPSLNILIKLISIVAILIVGLL
ncbi:MAG: sodium-translocating pyrophosphatase [Minisyncoccia bacterium]